jgi:hypothetical protein
VIADDGIKIEVMLNFSAQSSPRKSELMTAIGKLAEDENTVVVPMMIAGFTDSHNERIGVKALGAGVRRMIDLLKLIGTRE